MEAIQKFSAGQLNQATFECQLQGAFFLAAASSYMVMGTMLGYRCRRHFKHFLLVEAERQIIDAAIERPPVKASA